MSTPPIFVRDPAQPFQEGLHRDLVNVYPAREGTWACIRCSRLHPATTSRFIRHHAARCQGGPDSRCYSGPYCPHCAEQPPQERTNP